MHLQHKPLLGLVSAIIMVSALHAAAGHAAGPGPEGEKAYRAGIGLLNKGMHDLAAVELRAYLDGQGDGAQVSSARYALGVCLAKLGQHAQAATELDRVVSLDGFEFRADAMMLRAQCAIALADEQGAIEGLEWLVELHPEFAHADRAAALLGETLYRTGQYQRAEEVLSSVAKAWPASGHIERAWLFAALSEVAQGNAGAAIDRLVAMRAKYPDGGLAGNAALVEAQCRHRRGELAEAAHLYDLALRRGDGPVQTDALLGRAQVARASGKLDDASRALDQLANAPCSPQVRASAQLERGRVLMDQNQPDAALGEFDALARSAPDSLADDAAYWSAKCRLRRGEFGAATELLAAAARKFPDSELLADMLFDRAAAIGDLGDDRVAVAAWTQWREQFPEHELGAEALAAHAASTHRAKQYSASATLCEQFLSSFPKHLRAGFVELLLAENRFLANEFGAAETAYAHFLSAHVTDPAAWRARTRRGLSLIKLNRDVEGAGVLADGMDPGTPGEREPALKRAALLALGEHCLAQRDWTGAEKWFGTLASETIGQPDEGAALLRQALSVQRQGRIENARPILERVVALSPGSADALHARFEIGQGLAETGNLSEARAALESVVELERGADERRFTPHALRHLAAIASKQGRPADAAEALAALGDAGDGATLLLQGSAWLAAGKFVEAERIYSKILADSPSAPAAWEARARRAIAINRQGRHEEALSELRAADDQAQVGDPELVGSVQYEGAMALRALGRNDEAAEAYRALLKGGPSSVEAYAALDLAQLEIGAGHYPEAIALLDHCRSAVANLQGSDSARVREREVYARGLCLLKLGMPDQAVAALETFAKEFPTSELLPSVGLVLGESLLRSGQPQRAAKELQRILDAGPRGETASRAMLRLGDALAATRQWAACEQAYTGFLDRFPSSEFWFQARFGQGWARENQSRHAAAIEAYRQVTSSHQGATAARAQFQIGECLYAQKKYEEAALELLKVDVLYAYPEWSAAALYEAGRCFTDLGRPADASKQFDELMSRYPDTKWATLARERGVADKSTGLPGQPVDDSWERTTSPR
ncbi:MAG: tetratricopeptide repeat protein [Phycisphaerales bacterium]|nr:tetratricopeptide repeat protein [Phycisphaerales bacterium]